MRRLLLSMLLPMALLFSLLVPVVAADTATLTIEPDKTQITADGTETKITYTITVTPPAGKEIGVFSFRLKPSGDMTLPQSYSEDGQQVITYIANDLVYDIVTEKGVFKTYEYTPESNFFAAVGSREGHRMTHEAQIMTITASIPAGSSGVYAMDAEFTVAPDGSGESYIGRVDTTPVVVTDPNAGSSGEKTVVISDQDEPVAGQRPDTEIKVDTGGNGTVKTTTKWFCDGKELTGEASFEPGHVYTVEIHVKMDGGKFDTQVYANSGYSVERVSDTEVILKRSYHVEENYTQTMTEEEAAAQLQTGTAAELPTESPDEEPPPADGREAQEQNGGRSIALIAVCAVAAAAVICQVAVPGGLGKLFSKKRE